MHVVMSFMTSSWYMYTTQAYSSYSVDTRVRFVNARSFGTERADLKAPPAGARGCEALFSSQCSSVRQRSGTTATTTTTATATATTKVLGSQLNHDDVCEP